MTNLKNTLIVGNVICLAIIIVSGNFFAIQALKPMAKINKEAERINENNLGLRLNEGHRKDEISQLAITFNKLFDRLQDAFERQKRFVANASHELRTPLTSITGEIEVSLLKERSREEYVEVLRSVLDEAKTLTKLSNGLLHLAHAADEKGISIEKINLYMLIERVKEELQKRPGDHQLKLKYPEEISVSYIEINGNEELLKIALMNVIDNAFKFSFDSPVVLKVILEKKQICLQVIDTGIGVLKEELSKITHPFYRAGNAAGISGHGIGLSLSEKIIKLHEGNLTVTSSKHNGTVVSIFLPII